MWFWPGQTWDHNRLVYAVNRDLPDICMHSLFKKYNAADYKRMSFLQYNLMMFFWLTMLALPVKILLRLLLNIKYVMVTPWFNI